MTTTQLRAAVRGFASLLALIAAPAFSGTTSAQAIPKSISHAVADPARPQADRDRDKDRKPAECIAFAGLKPGQKIIDLIPGGGYFTRIFSAVVGPKGQVFAVAPPKRPDAPADRPEPAAAVQAIAADPHYANVSVNVERVAEPSLPPNVDIVWTSQNYHDVHNVANVDMEVFNKAILKALKPGGIYIVIDHATDPGVGFSATSTLHRSDPEAVKAEVIAAGFEFVASSDVLAVPTDDRKIAVFEKGLHDKTDRYVLKFRKPKG